MPEMNHWRRALLVLPFILLCGIAQASVILSGTRIVFTGGDKEATLQLTNDGEVPALIQTWLDKGDVSESPENIHVPFVMTPTIFRMEPHRGQALRILYSGEPLPADKESLFWLNVLHVPSKAEARDGVNHLQFAFRTRVKLMYRPKGLPGTASEAAGQLQWSLGTGDNGLPALKARNATAYVVNLAGIELRTGGQAFDAGVGYVLPGETASFPLKETGDAALRGGSVVFSSINDWGGSQAHEASLAQ